MAGAPKGNRNAATGRLFNDQIRKALQENDRQALKQIVTELIEQAVGGDLNAIKEVIDRSDGKAVQMNQHTGADGESIRHELTVKYVTASKK